MAKKIKLNIKNQQLAEALNLGDLKEKLAKRTGTLEEKEVKKKPVPVKKKAPIKKKEEKTEAEQPPIHEEAEESHPKIKARSKSAFSHELGTEKKPLQKESEPMLEQIVTPPIEPIKLGPTGKHVDDLLRPKAKEEPPAPLASPKVEVQAAPQKEVSPVVEQVEEEETSRGKSKVKQFKDFKPRKNEPRQFDSRDRQGLRDTEEDQRWRKKRQPKVKKEVKEDLTVRPTSLKIRIPITVKDLASEMKLKASQLIAKLLMNGLVVTLNDFLDDETTIQLLGQELGCEITIDTTEEARLRITDKTIKEEISQSNQPSNLKLRPPVVTFMGHVDHGKTSLIDAIRKSNRASGEAGAITQHIGAFRCHTPVGDITILDTPGHEAFSAMRTRGADVTDIVVLVVAGDEGMRQQTIEAMQQAKVAGVTIVVAINKCDKPNFNAELVYRELAEHNLLPEIWGGQTITVNTSAITGAGINQLLEMLALQAEILELKADPTARARGTVLESEMHKGLGMVATVLVQNGTLRLGDALVCDESWGRIRTMHNEHGVNLLEAPPSTPVEITGLSALPDAGEEFIVVPSEREAREIGEARATGAKQSLTKRRKATLESLIQDAKNGEKKILNVILRADVQGSLEAVKVALEKIHSDKVEINIIAADVGEVSESDIQLATASKAVIVGFHTQVESHAADLAKEWNVTIASHDVIYHAIDHVKEMMAGLLDKLARETDMGKAEVKATFKSSQHGVIAGCQVIEGYINRNHQIRVIRAGKVIVISPIQSLKRVKEDVREVQKGIECGILLSNFKDFQEGDILESFEITYIKQEL